VLAIACRFERGPYSRSEECAERRGERSPSPAYAQLERQPSPAFVQPDEQQPFTAHAPRLG
jgi:hypothetical protein